MYLPGLCKGLDPSTGTQSAKTSTFQSSGQFTKQTHTTQVDLLVVGGGGGGRTNNGGGGGGRGYQDGSVTVVDTKLGGSTDNAKVILRVVT